MIQVGAVPPKVTCMSPVGPALHHPSGSTALRLGREDQIIPAASSEPLANGYCALLMGYAKPGSALLETYRRDFAEGQKFLAFLRRDHFELFADLILDQGIADPLVGQDIVVGTLMVYGKSH
jgi:hypothetical protein